MGLADAAPVHETGRLATELFRLLNSGYIWNKTEIKLKQNNFVSVLFQM